MTVTVLICDDSGFARKQVYRALPDAFRADVIYAENGQEALDLIRSGRSGLMFLDLTMPVLDGYGVLEAIRRDDLNCMVIVISGDIQPAAEERVMKLGALGFIRKPVSAEAIHDVLQKFGLTTDD